MDYYGYSYFYIFFFFFIFLLLILILLTPGYTRKDVVPPLTTQNYAVHLTGSTPSYTSDKTAEFQPLKIADGESGSGGSALDFGGSGVDVINVDFSPEYQYKNRNVAGYFVLYFQNSGIEVSSSGYPSFLLRVRDYQEQNIIIGNPTLQDYNNGWTSLTMNNSTEDTLYKVILPFNVPSSNVHTLTVEIAPMNFSSYTGSKLRLNSAYIYYY